ncbi:MAG: hypothetical protein QOF75_2743 [Gaiellaceae bacterium]|jgi:hypothetical protein|nr:hypothetical protein [Gaiellaceae bacterium]
MTIRWIAVTVLAAAALAAAGVARAELVDPATGATAAGTADSLAVDDQIVDSPAAFDDADNALIADAQAAESGATVTPTTCLIRNPTVFRKVVRTSGQIVATPSGNLTIVCHGQVQAPSIVVGGAPSGAIVVKDGPCFFGKRQLARSQLVVTPSLNVTFVCHDNTA